ncbi:hypothetical protein VNO78_16132 [Psophocarpus tetragonolobus]|uniref:TF-B3 domain-containing protein n=1 Tax=Psophocarpus tetragonolobus TaxID=3891 RepID=A0AAN9SG68_PSOTE
MTSRLNHGDSASKPIHFFRIIDPQNLLQGNLKLPEEFVSKHGKHLSKTMLLNLPNGAEWKVNLEKRDGSIWFQDGWKEFMEYHSLTHGHLLVFKYNGTFHFDVFICDMTATEIDYPINKTNKKRLRINSEEIQPSKSQKTNENHRERNSYNLQHTSSRRGRDHKGMILDSFICRFKNLNEMTNIDADANLSFTLKIKPSHLLKQYVYLAKNPLKSYMKGGGQFVTLLVGDRSWRVKLINYPDKSVSYFTSQWSTFARENHLQDGDACMFQLLNSSDHLVMKVFICRRGTPLPRHKKAIS